jgi:cysteine synthase A
MARGILDCVGGTPLVELTGFLRDIPARVFAKLEFLNPGGSIKDRTALSMVADKVRSGELVPGLSHVVESSSGNLAVGLAQVCRYHGLRLTCVVDAKTTPQNLAILAAYGAEVEVVRDPDPSTGELLPVRLARVQELLAESPHAYWPNQYANPRNPSAHHRTMSEIVDRVGVPDVLVCATGTCGTIVGISGYVRRHALATRVVGVDAVGSVIFGDDARPRLIPGHGASRRPDLLGMDDPGDIVHVSDLDCVVGCRRLMAREAILAGGSSGAVVSALERLRDAIPAGATVVLILADRGERYLHSVYDDSWVARNFGEVSHLWNESGLVSSGRR